MFYLFGSCVLKASDISIDTPRPICWSISVTSRPTCMSADYSIAKPSMLSHSADTQPIHYRRSPDTLPTLGRYSTDTWSALSGSKFCLIENIATPKTGNRWLAGLVDGSGRPSQSQVSLLKLTENWLFQFFSTH